MIYQIVFNQLPEKLSTNRCSKWPIPQDWDYKYVYPWPAVKKCLEGTGDTLLWIITIDQLAMFNERIKKYDLEQYLVVDHRDTVDANGRRKQQGTTNRNYPERPLRLKVFIMKGAQAQ